MPAKTGRNKKNRGPAKPGHRLIYVKMRIAELRTELALLVTERKAHQESAKKAKAKSKPAEADPE